MQKMRVILKVLASGISLAQYGGTNSQVQAPGSAAGYAFSPPA